MKTTKDLTEVIRRKLASDPDLAAAVETELFNASVGSVIYEARTRAGLTQQQLADRVGMCQSAIARLEDADYYGHSLKTLERIAAALGRRVEITFVDCCTSEPPEFTEQFSFDETSWDADMTPWQPEIIMSDEALCLSGNASA